MPESNDIRVTEPDAPRMYNINNSNVVYETLDKPYYRVFKPLLVRGFGPAKLLRKSGSRVFSDRASVHLVRNDGACINLRADVVCQAQAGTLDFAAASGKTWAEYHSVDAVADPNMVFKFTVLAKACDDRELFAAMRSGKKYVGSVFCSGPRRSSSR